MNSLRLSAGHGCRAGLRRGAGRGHAPESEQSYVNPTPALTLRPPLPPGPFLVVGLARSGAAAARLLAERYERVFGVDSGTPVEASGLTEAGVEVSLGSDGTELLDAVTTIVKSPGVPHTAPVIAAARKRKMEIIGELELAWRAIPNRFFAVTGTNGKTTTVELLGHLHRTAGIPVEVAGNVGTALASLAGRLPDDCSVICEASSFQLEDSTEFAPECAVFLNLAPDHLDRHGTLENYLAAKLRIFAHQRNDDVAVYNHEQPELRGRDLGGCARRVPFCPTVAADPDCAVSRRDGVIFAGEEPLIDISDLKLLGDHNVENAMAAAAAALSTGLERDAVAEGLRSFEGVAHRLELIRELHGVRYVNDSKATNAGAALAAINSFDGGLHLILGGSLKGESFEELAEPVGNAAVAVYLTGEAAGTLEADLAPVVAAGVQITRVPSIAAAIDAAAAAAEPGQVVLLSPACASFDAYESFEQRGDEFRSIVERLQ